MLTTAMAVGQLPFQLDAYDPTTDVGRPIHELDTPALLVDLDLMESNIAHMASFLREAGVNWRPHTKGIKTPDIVLKLLEAGAIGVTCAKVSEAEVMAAAGIRDILIANQVVGPRKIARLMALCRHADPVVAVDSVENANELDEAAQREGVRLRVLIEVNVGLNRCGVEPGQPVVDLAGYIAGLPGLRLVGVMTWEGHIPMIPSEQKPAAVERSLSQLVASADMCRAAGIPLEIVSCGGTMTYFLSAKVKGVTEMQAGGGIFGDHLYRRVGADHPIAISVLATVISRPNPTRIVTDMGRKAMCSDQLAKPWPKDLPGVKSVVLMAEHGQIELEQPSDTPRIGDKLEWHVGYGDMTVCLHDVIYGVRNGMVEAAWPVLGRGRLQ